uniref:Uncharacterized protein n=1 Tax=Rhizophora mucronata TaxID=61149 RepID=A0A2P2QRU6_RHIMU
MDSLRSLLTGNDTRNLLYAGIQSVAVLIRNRRSNPTDWAGTNNEANKPTTSKFFSQTLLTLPATSASNFLHQLQN